MLGEAMDVLNERERRIFEARRLRMKIGGHGFQPWLKYYFEVDLEPTREVDDEPETASGRVIVSEALTHLLAAAIRHSNRPENVGEAGLTEQEVRILELIAGGMINKLIGRELDIAEGTVKVHVKHILRKLGLRSRVEAAVWAVERLLKPRSN